MVVVGDEKKRGERSRREGRLESGRLDDCWTVDTNHAVRIELVTHL